MSDLTINDVDPVTAASELREALEYEYVNNPVVHQLIFMVQLGELTPLEALARATRVLVAQNEKLTEDLLKCKQRENPQITIDLGGDDGHTD